LQVEYALVKNPMRRPSGEKIQRLYYDVSLLDCASPDSYTVIYQANNATGLRNVTELTDAGATAADHEFKVEKCSGYRQGITVTFSNDTICEPIRCTGREKCKGIYMFNRTRKDEPSKKCKEEYRGDMVVDLCVGNVGDGKVGTG
jgi:hypothetical protein